MKAIQKRCGVWYERWYEASGWHEWLDESTGPWRSLRTNSSEDVTVTKDPILELEHPIPVLRYIERLQLDQVLVAWEQLMRWHLIWIRSKALVRPVGRWLKTGNPHNFTLRVDLETYNLFIDFNKKLFELYTFNYIMTSHVRSCTLYFISSIPSWNS